MLYLTIKKHHRARKDGRDHAQAFYNRKARKYGEVLEQRAISTRRPVLITGAHHAGKSYWLDRLRRDAARVWASRAEAQPLHLVASGSLAEWVYGRHLELWWAGREGAEEDGRHWVKLRPHEKYTALPLYLRETGAVLFVDDAHAVNTETRKGKLLQACIRASGVWVMATQDEGRLFPGLRQDVKHADPQRFHLGTEVSYDGTAVFMYFLMAMLAAMGAWEAAAAVGGLRFLAGGARAAKQA